MTTTATAQGLDLVDPAYIYSQAPSKYANYMYIGYVPRMQDNQRIRVTISKAGLTMRVSMQMTPEEVIDYPNYLVRRFDQVNDIVTKNGLKIFQFQRYDAYAANIESIRQTLQSVRPDMQSRYEYGLALLKHFYPSNVFEIVENGSVARVEAHFVYPITIHRSESWPEPKEYRAYDMQERRSHFRPMNNEIFGGFPAIWLDPKGKGTGVHGPIRYSSATEGRRDGKKGSMKSFWAENNFLNETGDPAENLTPRLRWDLVRTNDSHGCFRAETLELRHLLPSDPYKIMDDNKRKLNLARTDGPGVASREIDYDSVVFDVKQGPDKLSVPGYFEERIVNVDYYLVNPYAKPDKNSWINQRLMPLLLTKEERKDKKTRDDALMSKMETAVQTFPYLNPEILEFATKSGGEALSIMTLLNQAH
jgi:hypothetical protein